MAREHHCPNCGPQPCNASTSKIHTCGVCAAIWEEDLSAPVPAPTPSKPPAPSPAAGPATPAAPPPPKPVAPVATPPKPAAPATPAPSPPAVTKLASASPAPAAAPAPSRAASPPAPQTAKGLSEALQEAKVKRCPQCQSDGLAQPSDFLRVQGRLVLVDSQTYRAHQWYADTGELLPTVAAPPPAPSATAAPPARPTAAT